MLRVYKFEKQAFLEIYINSPTFSLGDFFRRQFGRRLHRRKGNEGDVTAQSVYITAMLYKLNYWKWHTLIYGSTTYSF